MNEKNPSFRQHKTGVWFTKWGGQNKYFSLDREESRVRYLRSIAEWAEWRQARNLTRFPPMKKTHLVAGLVSKFLDLKELEGGKSRRSFYANHLRRFDHAYGPARGDRIRASDLQALKEDMTKGGYGPKTINHDLSAIKSLFLWASGMELIPAVNLRFAKGVSLPPTHNKAMAIREVETFLNSSPRHIRPWLAVSYFAMLRPSEIVRVVNRQGEWEQPYLFRLHKGKVDSRSQEFRRIVFSPNALKWLAKCEPRWTRQDSYYRAVERSFVDDGKAAWPGGPHPLRHSAATHLSQKGASRSDIDLLLGHLPPRVSRTYVQIAWQSLRRTVARLTLKLDA